MSSDLKVTNIKHASSGSNNLVLASDGTTTVNGALTASGGIANAGTISAGSIGSSVTGFTGIKNIDVWHVNANITGSTDPIVYSKWTRGSSASGGANLGTGMTLNNVSGSGIFTFPATGIWKVELNFIHQKNGDSRYIFDRIKVATNGKSGSFQTEAESRTFIQRTSSDTTYTNAYTCAFLDVTTAGDTGSSTAVSFQVAETGSSTLNASTNQMLSFVAFTRLADT